MPREDDRRRAYELGEGDAAATVYPEIRYAQPPYWGDNHDREFIEDPELKALWSAGFSDHFRFNGGANPNPPY